MSVQRPAVWNLAIRINSCAIRAWRLRTPGAGIKTYRAIGVITAEMLLRYVAIASRDRYSHIGRHVLNIHKIALSRRGDRYFRGEG